MEQVCSDCGTKMVVTGSGFTKSTRPRRVPGGSDGEVTVFYSCPNPDCPGKEDSGLAGPAAGERERVQRLTEGDSGLADGR